MPNSRLNRSYLPPETTGTPLPCNLVVVFGEEDYYRQQIVTALPEAVFKEVEPQDREIQVFDKDTDLNQAKKKKFCMCCPAAEKPVKVHCLPLPVRS